MRSEFGSSGNLGLRLRPQQGCELQGGRHERRLMGNPPPLRVDTPSLTWEPAVVTVPPVPAIPAGADPMSLMISAIMPELAAPLAAAVAETHAREEQFAANLAGARSAYQAADQAGEQEIRTIAEAQLAPAGPVTPGSAGNQAGQFMSTAMQTAGQAPMQLAGMAAAAVQGITQGAQGAVQQLGQLAGQFSKSVGDEDRPPRQSQEQDPQSAGQGAAAGTSPAELAPVDDGLPAQTPGRHPLDGQA